MAVVSSIGIPKGRGGGSISFQWVPDPKVVAARYDAAADYLENMIPPITLSREAFIKGVHETFETDGGSIGAGWEPWSVNYAPYAMARNIGGLLEQTGEMRSGVTDRGSYAITGRELFFHGGAAPARWLWHQEGRERKSGGSGFTKADLQKNFISNARKYGVTEAKRMHSESMRVSGIGGSNSLPARPMIGMSEGTEGVILTIFEDWFEGALVGATSTGQPIVRTPRGARFGPRY